METANRKILYVASSFLAGFSLMTVELVSSRIMAPIIGNSVFTWTSVIGMTLLGLSLGSFLGGIMADKFEPGRSLPAVFLSSAILVALIPLLSENVDFITDSSDSILKLNLYLATYLFFLPAVALGTIQPIILKKYADEFSKIGTKYGILSSVWSVGSVLGVFLTGFFFVSNFGTKETVWMMAVLLFLVGVIYAASERKLFIFFFLALLIAPAFFWQTTVSPGENSKILLHTETNYYDAKVVDTDIPGIGEARILFLDFDSHSIETKEANQYLYTELYPVFDYLKNDIKSILAIGAGAYTMPKHFENYYQEAEVSVIETDPKLVDIGHTYFRLGEYDIETIIGDAKVVLKKSTEKYDLIFGDAYNSFISVPWYLMTREWNDMTKSRLNEGGIYAINFIGSLSGQGKEFTESVTGTFRQTFPNFYVFAFHTRPEEVQNIVLVGIKGDLPIEREEFSRRIAVGENGFLSRWLLKSEFVGNREALTLTDNFSPVEKMMEPIMENYLPRNLSFMKSAF